MNFSARWSNWSFVSAIAALLLLFRFWDKSNVLRFANPDSNYTSHALPIFVLSTLIIGTLLKYFRAPKDWLLWGGTVFTNFILFGWVGGCAVLILPYLWAAILWVTPRLPIRLSILAIFLALGMHFRELGQYSLSFWWLFSQWLRALALAFEWKRVALSRREWLLVPVYFSAPAFLLSPIPMEWLGYRYFRNAVYQTSEKSTNFGAGLLWWSIGLLCLSQIMAPHFSWAYDLQGLNQVEHQGWFHLEAGWVFLVFRLFQYCSLTALVAGAWQFMGFPLRYDFNLPLVSQEPLEFWRRYHNYAQEFLAANIFYPVAFRCARHVSWQWSIGIAGVFVALLIWAVHALSVVPIANVPFSTTYTLTGSLWHTVFSGLLILLGRAWLEATETIPWRGLKRALRIGLTGIFLGWLFFNSYFQLWANFSPLLFFQSIFSF